MITGSRRLFCLRKHLDESFSTSATAPSLDESGCQKLTTIVLHDQVRIRVSLLRDTVMMRNTGMEDRRNYNAWQGR